MPGFIPANSASRLRHRKEKITRPVPISKLEAMHRELAVLERGLPRFLAATKDDDEAGLLLLKRYENRIVMLRQALLTESLRFIGSEEPL